MPIWLWAGRFLLPPSGPCLWDKGDARTSEGRGEVEMTKGGGGKLVRAQQCGSVQTQGSSSAPASKGEEGKAAVSEDK